MKNKELKEIGFWSGGYGDNSNYPDVQDFIDPNWDDLDTIEVVVAHLKNGDECNAYKGSSTCRVCGETNGSRELTDGTYVWPSGFLHYVLEHAVKPPKHFIDHCLENRMT